MSRATAFLAAVAAAACPAFASGPVYEVVWEGGDALPQTTFATLLRPSVVSTGQVVFRAFLAGSGIGSGNDLTLWSGGQPLPQLLCQEGDAYPPAGPGVTASCPDATGAVNGGPSAPVRVFGTTWLSGSGVTTADDTIRTVFAGTTASSVLVAREGDPAPGTDAVFDQAFGDHRVLPSGTVAFSGPLRAGTTTSGIWSGPASATALHVKAGDPAPGLGAAFQGFSGLMLSPSGHLVYRGYTPGGAAGLYRALSGGAPQLVASTGTAMPGGGTLLDVASWAVNRTGTVALQGYLSVSSTGVWVTGAGTTLRAVAVPGQAAPDYGTFAAAGRPSIGGDGICFFAQLSLGPDGLYCEFDGTLHVIARENDTPPALSPGETVGDLLWGPVLNRHRQVLFISQVTGAGGPFLTWWLRDTAGQLRVLARVGQALELAPSGLVKTVSNLDIPDGEFPTSLHIGSSSALNDRGEVVFLADFSDGTTGILLARPELLAGEEILADGFESGTTAGWSGTVGGLL